MDNYWENNQKIYKTQWNQRFKKERSFVLSVNKKKTRILPKTIFGGEQVFEHYM